MSVKLIAIGRAAGADYGFAICMIVNEAKLYQSSLFGINYEKSTGVIYIDILFITFRSN